jgi:hypothetical protein
MANSWVYSYSRCLTQLRCTCIRFRFQRYRWNTPCSCSARGCWTMPWSTRLFPCLLSAAVIRYLLTVLSLLTGLHSTSRPPLLGTFSLLSSWLRSLLYSPACWVVACCTFSPRRLNVDSVEEETHASVRLMMMLMMLRIAREYLGLS